MNITLDYQLNEADMKEFLANDGKAKKANPGFADPSVAKRRKWNAIFYLTLLTVVVAAILRRMYLDNYSARASLARSIRHIPTPTNMPLEFVLNLLPYILIFIVIWFFFIKSKGNGGRVLKKYPELAQPKTLHISEEEIEIRNHGTRTNINWTYFQFYYESNTLFLLYVAGPSAHLIPKRAFPNEESLQQFRTLCATKISKVPHSFPVEVQP